MNQRIAALDALRGLASVFVVVLHVAAMREPDLSLPPAAAPLVYVGGTGVVLFFVMSAFSLHLTWPRHVAAARPLLSFWLSRLLRIAPLLLALLTAMALRDAFRLESRYSLPEIAANASLLFGLFPQWQSGIVMGSWTIGAEVPFYLLFPLIVLYVRSLHRALIFTSATTFLWLVLSADPPDFAAHFVRHTGLITQLPLFALGGLCFYAWRHIETLEPRRRRQIGIAATLAGLASGLALIYLGVPAFLAPIGSWQAAALVYALLLLGLLQWSPVWLINRATCFLGTISYSLYLMHPLVIPRLYGVMEFLQGQGLSSGVVYLLSLALTLSLAVPLAWLTYRIIERPAIDFGRRWLQRRAGPALRATGVAS
ncbi:MAG: acyltransferase family protein [Lysobacter sp.]